MRGAPRRACLAPQKPYHARAACRPQFACHARAAWCAAGGCGAVRVVQCERGIQGCGIQGCGIQGCGIQGYGRRGYGRQYVECGIQGYGRQGCGIQGCGIQGYGRQGYGMWYARVVRCGMGGAVRERHGAVRAVRAHTSPHHEPFPRALGASPAREPWRRALLVPNHTVASRRALPHRTLPSGRALLQTTPLIRRRPHHYGPAPYQAQPTSPPETTPQWVHSHRTHYQSTPLEAQQTSPCGAVPTSTTKCEPCGSTPQETQAASPAVTAPTTKIWAQTTPAQAREPLW